MRVGWAGLRPKRVILVVARCDVPGGAQVVALRDSSLRLIGSSSAASGWRSQ